jgi:hypothetical protein
MKARAVTESLNSGDPDIAALRVGEHVVTSAAFTPIASTVTKDDAHVA